MAKSIATVVAVVSILSLSSLGSAQAGGATSAPSKYRNSASDPITESSTSSAHYAPKKSKQVIQRRALEQAPEDTTPADVSLLIYTTAV